MPTKYDREGLVNSYKLCVARATNRGYDDHKSAEQIVDASFKACRGAKQAMLSNYPRGWRASFGEEVDAELREQEMAWVRKSRESRAP